MANSAPIRWLGAAANDRSSCKLAGALMTSGGRSPAGLSSRHAVVRVEQSAGAFGNLEWHVGVRRPLQRNDQLVVERLVRTLFGIMHQMRERGLPMIDRRSSFRSARTVAVARFVAVVATRVPVMTGSLSDSSNSFLCGRSRSFFLRHAPPRLPAVRRDGGKSSLGRWQASSDLQLLCDSVPRKSLS